MISSWFSHFNNLSGSKIADKHRRQISLGNSLQNILIIPLIILIFYE